MFSRYIFSQWRHAGFKPGLAPALVILAFLTAATPWAAAQVGGRGPDPIPTFTQDVGGGSTPVTVTFDPALSYLPVPPTPNQTYLYTAVWDFGDGSAVVTVGPGSPAQILIKQAHIYNFVGTFKVTLRIDVTVVTGSTSTPGPSGFYFGQAQAANVNYPPSYVITSLSSPPTGALPYTFTVDYSHCFDPDGFIEWGAINWGDGAYTLIPASSLNLLPSTTALPLSHDYTAPGSYTVTLSIIDNGRIDAGGVPHSTQLNPTPPPIDPDAALTTITNLQQQLIDSGQLSTNFDNPILNPILRQTTLQVVVPGNLAVIKGSFTINFTAANADKFASTFLLNVPVASISNAQVKITLGNGGFILPTFTTDLKGNYFNNAQKLKFSVNPKKKLLALSIGQASLQSALGIINTTVVNGFVDVPLTFTITGGTGSSTIAANLRFVYNSKQGSHGVGAKPRSK